MAHCAIFSAVYCLGAYYEYYSLGILYDVFGPTIGALNIFGLVFCALLYVKGLYFPSTADSGTSGGGPVFDYYWGTELSGTAREKYDARREVLSPRAAAAGLRLVETGPSGGAPGTRASSTAT